MPLSGTIRSFKSLYERFMPAKSLLFSQTVMTLTPIARILS